MKQLNRLKELNKPKELLSTLLFYLSILTFIIGFNFSDTPLNGGWTQQFMPNLGGRSIVDITFTDSLNGYAITNRLSVGDTSFILKTSNGGDNWIKIYWETTNSILKRIQFLNQNTGYVGGLINFNYFLKTTNAGTDWFYTPAPYNIGAEDMYVLNEDTIWFVNPSTVNGGIFRTTNGGLNWETQFSGSGNPDKIYMHNGRFGFANRNGGSFMYRTTNSGQNWDIVAGENGFRDIYFIDTLVGWKCSVSSGSGMKKTTNGGLNWIEQTTAQGGIIQSSFIYRFSNVNSDTIWGTGGYILYPNNQTRGLLHRTTNGGGNWLFQIPDTSIHLGSPTFIDFVDHLKGWGYQDLPTGIHTTTGGDTTFYTGIQHIQNAVPEKFILKQNYPNPFNPRTVIPYSVSSSAYVKIIAYDITGREVQRMVDSYHQAGAYEVDFIGKFTSTGVYLYRMTVTDAQSNQVYTDTKKMILLK